MIVLLVACLGFAATTTTANNPNNNNNNNNTDVKLVLMGSVLLTPAKAPMANINVELLDPDTQTGQSYTTMDDGMFSFSLQSDKLYHLYIKNADGEFVAFKTIDTIGKIGPQILHTVLEISGSEMDNGPLMAPFNIIEQDNYTQPNK